MRTPDELRLSQIADFFGVTVEYLRRDNLKKEPHSENALSYHFYDYGATQPATPALREPEAPPYGLPSLRRDDNMVSGANVAELALIAARLLGMIGTTTKGVSEGKFDIGKTIVVLRRLSDILEQKLREADTHIGALPPMLPHQQY